MQAKMHKNTDIKLVWLVCDRARSKEVQKILGDQQIFFNLVTYGHGTATSKVLKYLGIGDSEKAISCYVAPGEVSENICQLLCEKLQLEKPGHGIMFMANLKQVCYHIPVSFDNEENGENVMAKQDGYNLIMTISNRGYSDEVMDAARAAGANGGTIVHARGGGSAGMEKFFGLTIAPDKEMILIVAKEEDTTIIMEGIAAENGPESEAACVSFAIPVSHVNGIRDYSAQVIGDTE